MMQILKMVVIGVVGCMLIGCTATRSNYSPHEKLSPEALKKDFTLFRNVLEESHPSLYWFTPKDSVDYFFDQAYSQLTDSMHERQFRTLLSYVVSKLRCGHTSVRYSREYTRYLDTARLKIFPLHIKMWSDTMVVLGNLNRKDSVLRRGTVINHINNYTGSVIRDTFFNFISADGHAINGRYQSISNRGNFGTLYRNVFGLPDSLTMEYIDTLGFTRSRRISVFNPLEDTTGRTLALTTGDISRRDIRSRGLNTTRNIQIDTTLKSAYMTVNTFSRGNRLRGFFRRSFRVMRKHNIKYLVIDVRSNGGGDAGNSTLLTQYVINRKFKIADSLYAITRRSNYGSHIRLQPVYWFMMQFVTKKQRDGLYHFGYFERHYFKPKKKNHFSGKVYIVTGGNSFSATTLFAQAVKGQENVMIVGEETGGGAYGNTAWMIPDVTLPNSRLKFRLPKFRLVMNSALVKEGRGVLPDIEVLPTVESIRHGIDLKVEVVRQLILMDRRFSK